MKSTNNNVFIIEQICQFGLGEQFIMCFETSISRVNTALNINGTP